MSWDDDWDDDPRPRYRHFGDDLRREMPAQSGAVTAAGIISIIMAVLCMLCGGCTGVTGLFCGAVGAGARQGGNILPPDLFDSAAAVFLTWALVHVLLAVALLIGGIVTLNRRNGGRITLLICGAAGALIGIVQFIFFILIGTNQFGGGLFGNADPDARIGQAVMGCLGALVYFAYAIFVYIVLLSSHNREEFD